MNNSLLFCLFFLVNEFGLDGGMDLNSSLLLLPSSLKPGGVAQLESEHFSTKEKVAGSSPAVPVSPKAEK